MCDFGGPPKKFRLVYASWEDGHFREIFSDTIFEDVPCHGDVKGIPHDPWHTSIAGDQLQETGLYYVCCTGSHYVYYDAEKKLISKIERLDNPEFPWANCKKDPNEV